MRAGWLLRDGQVLAATDVADGLADRSRCLAGRRTYDRALVLSPSKATHSFATPFRTDVAFLDRNLRVVETIRLDPWRITLPRWRCRTVLQATAGSFERWELKTGDQVELRIPA